LEDIAIENRVYLDESGIADGMIRDGGWARQGERLWGEISGKRRKRISVIAALISKRVLAPFRFEGYCNSEVFNTYLENVLIAELRPGQTVILDNASFHKSARTRNLITKAGCDLLFLPAYSPDLNPIEHTWAQLKKKLRYLPTPSKYLHRNLDLCLNSIISNSS